MRLAFFSAQSYDRTWFDRFKADLDILYIPAAMQAETVSLAAGCTAVCVFVNDVLDATVISALQREGVRLIALRCAGFNNVDLAAAKAAGIIVVRVPAYSPHAVAEHAVALLLTVNRKTHKAYNRIREGNFSLEKLEGFDLYGKTVGVIGTGKIGAAFAGIMLGFGCRVLAHDLYPQEELQNKGVTYVPLRDLLQQSRIVSLHCPLTPETQHLINDETLALLPAGATLINTSRGALIDTAAVIRALKHRHLGQLAIDVYEQEDKLFFRDHSEEGIDDGQILRLMSFPNVLITAHQGFFTEEALGQIARITLQNICDFAAGKTPENSC